MSDISASPDQSTDIFNDVLSSSLPADNCSLHSADTAQSSIPDPGFFASSNELFLEESLVPKFTREVFKDYHHITWFVSNSKQAASYFVMTFGFNLYAYRGLETGSRDVCSYVLKNGDIIFEFCSPLRSSKDCLDSAESCNKLFKKCLWCDEEFSRDRCMMCLRSDNFDSKMINEFIDKHGDGVKDVAFNVCNIEEVYNAAVGAGAKSIQPVKHFKKMEDDATIYVATATVQVMGDTFHTLVQKSDHYKRFLPGYELISDRQDLNPFKKIPIINTLPKIHLRRIDHCVQNQDWNKMVTSCEDYAYAFGFKQFWSVDERQVFTQFSALHSIVMTSPGEKVKMPVNEPAKASFKSQIEEFIEYYNGPGVQHIALLTDDIIYTVESMKERGVEFIEIPQIYYRDLARRLQDHRCEIEENMMTLKKLGILVDFDEDGYLLQLFTKPLGPRPTIFIEIIQRKNHNGFGAGNFKALFQALESLQSKRGNLVPIEEKPEPHNPLFLEKN